MKNEITIQSNEFQWCRTTLSASASNPPIPQSTPITLCIRSGCASLQTYATREEARALACMLLEVANEVEKEPA